MRSGYVVKIRSAALAALASASACVPNVQAADINGYLVLTTDYVFRGVSLSDSDPAAQLGADVEFDNGLYFGAWGSTIDISNGPGNQRDLELIYYAGYSHDVSDRWVVSANIVAYTYPGAEGIFDYDYVEYSAGVNYRDRIWLEYSYSPDLYNTGYSTHNVEAFAEWPLAGQWSIGAGVGRYDTSELTGSAYTYWQLGVTRSIDRFDIDLRYHDTSRWVPIVSTPDRAEARAVLSARLRF